MGPEMGVETMLWPDGIPELVDIVVVGVGLIGQQIPSITKHIVHLSEEAVEDGGSCCHRLDDSMDGGIVKVAEDAYGHTGTAVPWCPATLERRASLVIGVVVLQASNTNIPVYHLP